MSFRFNIRIITVAFISFCAHSCTMTSIIPSEKRCLKEQGVQLSPKLKLSSTGAVYMTFGKMLKSDFFPASFKIEYGDQIILLDPVALGSDIKADYIFISHKHADHFYPSEIEKHLTDKTIIIGPKPVVKKLKTVQTTLVKVGDQFKMDNITVDVVASYNIRDHFFEFPIHRKSNRNVGYVIACDSVKIYLAGDTDFIPEMKDLEDVTVALVPIGVGKAAMNAQEAAKAVNCIHPDIAIPIHYLLNDSSYLDFERLTDKSIDVKVLSISQ